jgi:hypothetical protein
MSLALIVGVIAFLVLVVVGVLAYLIERNLKHHEPGADAGVH